MVKPTDPFAPPPPGKTPWSACSLRWRLATARDSAPARLRRPSTNETGCCTAVTSPKVQSGKVGRRPWSFESLRGTLRLEQAKTLRSEPLAFKSEN